MKRQAEHGREEMAEHAALLRLVGGDTRLIYPVLRRLTTTELLALPAAHSAGVELNSEIERVCAAALCAVRRRSGWLNLRLADTVLYAGVSRRQLHAALLCFLRDALRSGTTASICCHGTKAVAMMFLRSGSSTDTKGNTAETTVLLRRLAQDCGGTAVFAASGTFSAALRLPLRPELSACAAAQGVEELVTDRYSLLYIYLYRFCVWPDE